MRLTTILAAALWLAAQASGQAINAKLKGLDGRKVELADLYRDRALVVSFWATWCKPCCEELKHFQRLSQTYSDSGVAFLGICINEAKEQGKVRTFMAGSRYDFPVALDPEQQAMRKFGLKDVPGSFILEKGGRISWQHAGYKPGDQETMEAEIRKRLPRAVTDSGASNPDTTGGER